jgi:hypothetical protein
MGTDVLMVSLRGTAWDFIPDDLWHHILLRFAPAACDGVSFDSIACAEDIARLSVFADHVPKYLGQISYRPYSIPASVTAPESHERTVALFRFDEWIASLIDQQPFNSWGAGHEGADVDELVFWANRCRKLHAVPHEGQIYFDRLTPDERRCLVGADERIESNLYKV